MNTSIKKKRPLVNVLSRRALALLAVSSFLLWGCTQAPASPAAVAQPPPSPSYQESSRPQVQRQSLPAPPGPLQGGISEAEKATILAFAQAFKKVDKDWDALQADYDSWRRSESTCNRDVMRQDLEQLLADFSPIIKDSEALSRAPQTRSVAESLVKAEERGQKALRTLKDNWKPADKSAFEAFEAEKAQVNLARRQAADELQDLIAKASRPSPTPTPSEEPLDPRALDAFSKSVTQLNNKWDNFHTTYDQWRQKGGKCDKQGINLKLVSFATRLSDIKKSIGTAEQTPLIRPLRELLLEAALREEDALRTLRQTWEPYEPTQFNQFESIRQEINKLRRQALAGLEELLAKY